MRRWGRQANKRSFLYAEQSKTAVALDEGVGQGLDGPIGRPRGKSRAGERCSGNRGGRPSGEQMVDDDAAAAAAAAGYRKDFLCRRGSAGGRAQCMERGACC